MTTPSNPYPLDPQLARRVDLLNEAERRGILPEDKRAPLHEARRRGLVPAPAASAAAIFEVELPDGEIIEVEGPENTPHDQVRQRVRSYLRDERGITDDGPWTRYQQQESQQEGPWTKYQQQEQRSYTMADLEQALYKADAAGNVEDARMLADEIRRQRALLGQASTPPQKPQERSLFQNAAEAVGKTARASLEGAGSFVGLFTDPLDAGLAKLTGGQHYPMRQAAASLADRVGLPSPETAGERVASDVIATVSGGGLFRGAGTALARSSSPVASQVGRRLTEAPRMQMASEVGGSMAAGMTRENGGDAKAQGIAALLGGLSPIAANYAPQAGIRGLLRGGEQNRQAMTRTIADFVRAGTTPTVAQASQTGRSQFAEAIIRNAPGGAGRMAAKVGQQGEEIGERIGQIADSLSPAEGAERGGRAVIRGISGPGGFMERFRAKSGELYDAVEQLLPQGAQVQATNSQRVLSQLTTPIAGAESTSKALMSSKVGSLAQAFADDLSKGNGTLPYASLKALRSQLGEMIADTALTSDTPTKQLRALYGAMSDDLNSAARASGDPKVINAVTRANHFYRAAMQRVEEIERVVDRNGGPEAVYRALFNGSREGGTTLRQVMQSLDPKAQKELAAVTLRRLGKANPSAQNDMGEVFNPETFLTNWNRMAPEAKAAMFDRFGPRFSADMDAVVRATARMREAARVLPNPSGTAPVAAQVSAYTALMGGGFGALFGAVSPLVPFIATGALATSNLLARVLTNPRAVNWLAMQTAIPPAALPNQLRMLKAMADSTGDEDLQALHALATGTAQSPR